MDKESAYGKAEPTEVRVPYPEGAELHLRIAVGACRLKISPTERELWVSGTYTDPSNAVPLRVEQDANGARISQSFIWPQTWGAFDHPPTLELALGTARPYALTLEVGANDGSLDLGGLPITRLVIRHGAGKLDVDFSAPNPRPMEQLTVTTGAADFEMRGLANANFAEMLAEGGAAAMRFEFGGQLARDAQVRVTTGMTAVDLRIPATTAAQITAESVLGGVEVSAGFTKSQASPAPGQSSWTGSGQGTYYTQAAVEEKKPMLTIRASVAMGGIRLHSA